MKEDLKPCPFCGSRCKLIKDIMYYTFMNKTSYGISCENKECLCASNIGYDKEDVVNRWNTRKEESK